MLETSYTWRPLGELLLELAGLRQPSWKERSRSRAWTGRLMGEILVASGHISTFTLGRALASQHGVELQTAGYVESDVATTTSSTAETEPTAWRPLGKLLIEKEFLTQSTARACTRRAARKRRSPSARRDPGWIRLPFGRLPCLPALADQHGLELEFGATSTGPSAGHSAPDAPYQVREVLYGARLRGAAGDLQERQFPRGGRLRRRVVEDLERPA